MIQRPCKIKSRRMWRRCAVSEVLPNMLVMLVFLAGCDNAAMSPGGGSPPASADDDLWAIRVYSSREPEHASRADGYGRALKTVKGLKADLVRVVHSDTVSTVYYGRYRQQLDLKSGRTSYTPDYSPELAQIRGLTLGGSSEHPFAAAMIDALPPPPSANSQWDLLSQNSGYWSLQVGVFYNTEGMTRRRQAAEEYCKLLRDQGEQAFFHHGASNSSVCIGLFPREAIATMNRTDESTGVSRIVSEIVDPKLIDLQKKHPKNVQNGHIINQIRRDAAGNIVERVAEPSFVVQVPRAGQMPTPAAKRP